MIKSSMRYPSMCMLLALSFVMCFSGCIVGKKVQVTQQDLVGNWLRRNNDASTLQTNLVLRSDGTCYFQFSGDYNRKNEGTWSFTAPDYFKMITKNGASISVDEYTIVRWENNEMHVDARQATSGKSPQKEKLLYKKVE